MVIIKRTIALAWVALSVYVGVATGSAVVGLIVLGAGIVGAIYAGRRWNF